MDLKNYDALILITVIQVSPPASVVLFFQLWTSCLMLSQNIMGMSVVGGDYDQLKRYNLAELYSPTPKPQAPEKKESETTESKS